MLKLTIGYGATLVAIKFPTNIFTIGCVGSKSDRMASIIGLRFGLLTLGWGKSRSTWGVALTKLRA